MINDLIYLLIALIVIGIIWYIGTLILGQFPSPLPLATIWNLIMLLVCLLVVLKFLLPLVGIHAL
jgi:putative effector of murein hydrolase LrgA (UPF0299 family)